MSETAMHQHARICPTDQLLTSNGGDVVACDVDGKIPAHFAARRKQPDVLKALLQALKPQYQTALVDTRDKEGNTVTYHAALSGCVECIKLAIQTGGDLTLTNREGKTPLMAAAGKGHEQAVRCLLEGFETGAAETLSCVNKIDKKGRTAMHHAARNCHSAVIKLLLSRGGDRRSFDYGGKTPVHWATGGTHPTALTALLEGLDPAEQTELANLCEDFKRSVLYLAIWEGCLECFKIVYLAGGRLSKLKHCHEDTVLAVAAECGNLEVVLQVLDNFDEKTECISKVDYVNLCDDRGTTALHHAATQGYADIVEVLIRHGADRQVRGIHDWSPLGWAVRMKHPGCAKILLRGLNESDRAALVNMSDIEFGSSVIQLAVMGGCTNCIDIVYRAGGTLSKADNDGSTALFAAATSDFITVAEHLLDIFNEGREELTKSEFINKRNLDGVTAMHVATRLGRPHILQLLISQGGEICTSMMSVAVDRRSYGWIKVLHHEGIKLSEIPAKGGTMLIDIVLGEKPREETREELVIKLLDLFDEKEEGMTRAAYIDMEDKDGKSALQHAAEKGFVDVEKTLIAYRAIYHKIYENFCGFQLYRNKH